MIVKIKKLTPEAVIPFKTHGDDFCYDLVATSCEEIAPNVYKYGTGLAFEIDEHGEYPDFIIPGLTIRPRSSICKTGLVLSNSLGTVDFSFRGEVSAVFYHVIPSLPIYKVGDRIAQIHLDLSEQIGFIVTDTLTPTDRGTGGYGSTGK